MAKPEPCIYLEIPDSYVHMQRHTFQSKWSLRMRRHLIQVDLTVSLTFLHALIADLLLCPFQYNVLINGMSYGNVPFWGKKPQLWYPRLSTMLNLHGMCSNRSRATFSAADWHYCVNSSKWFPAYLQFTGSCKHCSKHFTQKLVSKLLVVVIISRDGCG